MAYGEGAEVGCNVKKWIEEGKNAPKAAPTTSNLIKHLPYEQLSTDITLKEMIRIVALR